MTPEDEIISRLYDIGEALLRDEMVVAILLRRERTPDGPLTNVQYRVVRFPRLDDHGTPLHKLPNCPRCGQDELGVIHGSLVKCYACSLELWGPG